MLLLDPDAHPIVAHRGASGTHPENTLLAFRAGLRHGAQALELDIRLTADGVPVVIHDPSLDRTTNGTGLVADVTLAALRELDAGRGEGVPTLAEVLEQLPEVPCVVEIKEVRAAEPARDVLARYEAAGRVLVGSFQPGALRPFGAAPWHRAASRRETALWWALSRIGSRPPGRGYEAFTLPEHHGSLHVVDERFVRQAARGRKPVHVWTVDDPTHAARLLALGVSGIITNFPERMAGVVAAAVGGRGLPLGPLSSELGA